MWIRSWFEHRGGARAAAVVACLVAVLLASCTSAPTPDPTPVPTVPPTEFAPLAADAAPGLESGTNDFVNGFAVLGDTVVAVGTVFGDRWRPRSAIPPTPGPPGSSAR